MTLALEDELEVLLITCFWCAVVLIYVPTGGGVSALSSRPVGAGEGVVTLSVFFALIFILIGYCFVLKVPFLDASRISQS